MDIQYTDFILLKDINVEVSVRYVNNKQNKKEREWFTQNFAITQGNKKYHFPFLLIDFTHIEKDNPEFFLQSGQIILIVKGKVMFNDADSEQALLVIDRFQHLSESDR